MLNVEREGILFTININKFSKIKSFILISGRVFVLNLVKTVVISFILSILYLFTFHYFTAKNLIKANLNAAVGRALQTMIKCFNAKFTSTVHTILSDVIILEGGAQLLVSELFDCLRSTPDMMTIYFFVSFYYYIQRSVTRAYQF